MTSVLWEQEAGPQGCPGWLGGGGGGDPEEPALREEGTRLPEGCTEHGGGFGAVSFPHLERDVLLPPPTHVSVPGP